MKRFISAAICIILIISSFAGCSSKPAVSKVRIAGVMNSPSAFLSFMFDKSEGNNEYVTTAVNLPNRIRTLLLDDECDIAIVPVDTACNIYKRANPQIKIIAGISVGGFDLVSSTDISDYSELKGKTVYLTERDTHMADIFEYLLELYDLNIHYDVKISYADDMSDLKDAFADKEAEVALLTSAEATELKSEIGGLESYSLVNELAKKFKKPSIVTYCVIGTTKFIEENPKAIDTLLKDIEKSVTRSTEEDNTEELIKLGKEYEFLTDDIYGEEFLNDLKPAFISGNAMKTKMNSYFKFVYKFKSSLVGKVINKEDLFYISDDEATSSEKSSSEAAANGDSDSSVSTKTESKK